MLAQDPPLPRHPPRSATPPGECGRARLARERAARPPRALRSRTRARRQPRVTCAWPWQQQQRAPWQQPAPPRPRRGCGEVVRPSRGARSALRLPPGRAPAPRSPLTSLARVPQACAAGCCCWLLAAGAAGAHHVRLGGTCGPAAPYSPSLIRPWRPAGAADILWARAAGRGCTAITSPTSPPALLPPPTLPPPTFWASRYAAVERVAPDVRALLCENYA